MNDIKPVVTEVVEVEYWDDSIKSALFESFGQSRFSYKNKTERLFKCVSLYKCETFDGDLDERSQICYYVEILI